ncbi:RNA polymerase sigma-70 factor (ECF subfamily) [Pedobacter sp. AK017]|uniref:sigma-70 family RNA polymerase sigma factor n=1 Tax=Pedobacter sp. AK017 TaxID=2723073 RepID=UPI00161D45BB|nr:sigma-70 family RNA polymerase sigma factor [Pedobacter sp. AK017]MBB5438583.1 RNA polymerase sigma-70 factor (ECF subfamily) [Pedobacter sp. AK017]
MMDLRGVSDQELLLLLKKDDERAMAEIITRYWQRMLAVAINRLDNQQEAEECVQDVFMRFWQLRVKLELKYTLYTYLSAAVRYRVYNLLDSQHRKFISIVPLSSEMEISSGEFHADSELLEKELLERIAVYVDQLPQKCRIVYKMSREDGKSNEQIATELKITEKTVEAHLTKAVKDIRENLAGSSAGLAFLLLTSERFKDLF